MERTSAKVLASKGDVGFSMAKMPSRLIFALVAFSHRDAEAVSRALGSLSGHPDQRVICLQPSGHY